MSKICRRNSKSEIQTRNPNPKPILSYFCRHTSTPYIGMKIFVETLTPRVRLSVLSAAQRHFKTGVPPKPRPRTLACCLAFFDACDVFVDDSLDVSCFHAMVACASASLDCPSSVVTSLDVLRSKNAATTLT